MVKWTREQIIREILRREAAGLPLTLGSKQGVPNAFYQASSRVFGSWLNAIKAAGVAPHQGHKYIRWSTRKVLLIIRALSRRRRPLRSDELHEQYGALLRAARRAFGSWRNAVIAAGIDPQKMRHEVPWTEDRIIEAILKCALTNKPLNKRSVEPRSLVRASERVFGSWELALVAAGLDPQQYVHKCCAIEQSAQVEIDQLNLGQPVAVKTATAKERHHWSDRKVIQAIHKRLRKKRQISAKAVCKDNLALYQAARRRFGNWSNALKACGLDPAEFRKHGAHSSSALHSSLNKIPGQIS